MSNCYPTQLEPYQNPYGQYMPNPYSNMPHTPISPNTPVYPPINPVTPLSPYLPMPPSYGMVPQPSTPMMPPIQEGPPPVTELDYIPGYLAANIGKNIKAEFVVGLSQYVEKVGRLIDVGVNYFVLADINSRTNIMCDLYSVKFVTIIVG